jgi:predicted transcriptional regulator
MFVCLQISEEMWQFDSSGNLYFDKAALRFLKELFDHWKVLIPLSLSPLCM